MTWPITWPASANADDLDPNIKRLCEVYASACMTALTLNRVGGDPVTIMPAAREIVPGRYLFTDAGDYRYGFFYPSDIYPSAEDLRASMVLETSAFSLPAPIGAVLEVRVDGEVLDPAKYRVEDGRWLVRIDGQNWPEGRRDGFTVTYLNAYPVDEMGSYAAGVMAAEWLKLLAGGKDKCRLPRSVTNVQRQGLTFEIARGMFPDGVTGMPEVDAYLLLWNPHGLKVAPRVYSPDLPRDRQVYPR